MIFDLLLFAGGLVALYFGSEYMVDGASRLATSFGVQPFIVGLTVVAFGTSAPELLVSGVASAEGNGSIAVGNVVGSNIANIALILGVAALIRPMKVQRGVLVRDVPIMIGLTALTLWLMWDGEISRWDCALLLGIFVPYLLHVFHDARKEGSSLFAVEEIPSGSAEGRGRSLLVAFGGLIGLIVGARLLVDSAVAIARDFGVSEVIIGVTLVAFGTSLPELATTVSASRRNEAQIVLGNVVGSNIFNLCLVLGVAGLIRPLPIEASVLRFDGPIMILLSLALPPLVYTGLRLNRWEGAALLVSYSAFIGYTIVS